MKAFAVASASLLAILYGLGSFAAFKVALPGDLAIGFYEASIAYAVLSCFWMISALSILRRDSTGMVIAAIVLTLAEEGWDWVRKWLWLGRRTDLMDIGGTLATVCLVGVVGAWWWTERSSPSAR